MIRSNKFSFLLLVLIAPLFFSCSARIDGTVKEGGAAEIKLQASLEPRATALIRTLRSFMGGAADGPVLDSRAISSSLSGAPGIAAISLSNTGPSALNGGISVSKIEDFLTVDKGRFITYTEGSRDSSIIININRDSAPDLISRLSPDAAQYLSALMAPAVLGENSTKKEYLDLVASVYGNPLADEIAAARIRAFIEFPRPPKSVLGGNPRGRIAEFEIPLLDILVLETPLRYEVTW